jgi:hypothetical protein
VAGLSEAAGGQPPSTATSSSTYGDDTMEVQASGGQPTTTQSTETSSSSGGAIPKQKKSSYAAAATVSTSGGEAQQHIFDPALVTTEMLSHYLAQVKDPTHVSEATCKRIMDMALNTSERIQQTYLSNVTNSTNLTPALFMRISRDADMIHKLKKEREQAVTECETQNRELNRNVCERAKIITDLNVEHSNILQEIAVFETTHKRKDGLEESNKDLLDQNKIQVPKGSGN